MSRLWEDLEEAEVAWHSMVEHAKKVEETATAAQEALQKARAEVDAAARQNLDLLTQATRHEDEVCSSLQGLVGMLQGMYLAALLLF